MILPSTPLVITLLETICLHCSSLVCNVIWQLQNVETISNFLEDLHNYCSQSLPAVLNFFRFSES